MSSGLFRVIFWLEDPGGQAGISILELIVMATNLSSILFRKIVQCPDPLVGIKLPLGLIWVCSLISFRTRKAIISKGIAHCCRPKYGGGFFGKSFLMTTIQIERQVHVAVGILSLQQISFPQPHRAKI